MSSGSLNVVAYWWWAGYGNLIRWVQDNSAFLKPQKEICKNTSRRSKTITIGGEEVSKVLICQQLVQKLPVRALEFSCCERQLLYIYDRFQICDAPGKLKGYA